MIYTAQIKIPKIDLGKKIQDEYVIRNLASTIVQNLPFESLKKIFNIEVVDPNTYEVKKEYEQEFINMLKKEEVVLFNAELNVEEEIPPEK